MIMLDDGNKFTRRGAICPFESQHIITCLITHAAYQQVSYGTIEAEGARKMGIFGRWAAMSMYGTLVENIN